MKKMIVLSVLVFGLVGCGSSGDTYVASTEPALPELPTSGEDSFIITNTGDESSAGMSYSRLDNGSILIDCTNGTCGDVYVASPVDDSETDASECSGGGCGK